MIKLKDIIIEVQAMNMDTVPYNTIMKMKPGSTIKMKDGKIRTKDKFGNWRANTDRNDIIVNRDLVKHMKGMKGYNMGNGRVQIEGKLTEDAVAAFTKDLTGERIKAKVYTATGDGKTVEAQFTNKKWEDGVPVTKNLTRGGYKSIKTPRGKFKVIETEKFFYYEINNGWAAVSRKRYTTPPFEY